jgi:hypothetical protein
MRVAMLRPESPKRGAPVLLRVRCSQPPACVEGSFSRTAMYKLHHADEDLMPLVEVGDPDAFAALYDRHGRMAYSLAYRMMGE